MSISNTNQINDALLNSVNTRNVGESLSSAVQETEDRFLKLLVAQMINQDPLNPMDNAQVTSQMAQLSTVTGINRLNDTLDMLMSSLSVNQMLEAASMIGHGVLVNGDTTVLSRAPDTEGENGEVIPGQAMSIMGIDLSDRASNILVNIYNQNGALVQTISLGQTEAGVIPISWDGSTNTGDNALPGQYTFTVTATNAGQSVKANPLSFGEVMSVSQNADNQVTLNVLTLGTVRLSDIRQIL